MPRARLRHFILHSILFHIFLGVVITLALIYFFDKETGSGGGKAGGRLEPIVVTVIDDGEESEGNSQETPETFEQEEQEKENIEVDKITELPEEEALQQIPEVKPVNVRKETQKKKIEQSQEKSPDSETQKEVAEVTDTAESSTTEKPGRDSDIETDNTSPGDVALNMTEGARPDYGLNPTPPYPKSARRRGYEGTVLLRVLVLESGKVGKIQVKSPSGYSVLDDSALKAVKDWTFIPGKIAGKSIQSWVEVPIKYQLDSG